MHSLKMFITGTEKSTIRITNSQVKKTSLFIYLIRLKGLNLTFTILLLLISLLFIYVVLRAGTISFTHDECISFKIITGDPTFVHTANNHFLNTSLMSILYSCFGGKELVLRIPNLFAFLIYAFYSYQLLSKINNFYVSLAGATLILLNPYLLEYFSLARGYGLALGFALGSLYYFLSYSSDKNDSQFVKCFALSIFFSLLSVYSNLIYLNLNITILAVYLIALFRSRQGKGRSWDNKKMGIIATIVFLNILFLLPAISQLLLLKENNQLYFGGQQNFIDNTLTILIHRSIYFSYYGEVLWKIVRVIVILFFLLALISQLYVNHESPLQKITVVLLLMIFANILQHYVFDVLYPMERTALFYIPLYSLLVVYLLAEYSLTLKASYEIVIFNALLVIFLTAPLIYHFYCNLNLKHSLEWAFDSEVKQRMQLVMMEHNNTMNWSHPISLSSDWNLEPAINYYRKMYSMDYLIPADRNGINESSDFIFCTRQEYEELKNKFCYIPLNSNKELETLLLKKIE